MSRILIILTLCMACSVTIANEELLSVKDQKQRVELYVLQWKHEWTQNDRSLVESGLRSRSDKLAAAALQAATVNRMSGLANVLRTSLDEGQLGPTNGWTPRFARIVLDALKNEKDDVVEEVKKQVFSADSSVHELELRDMARRLVVVDAARLLRANRSAGSLLNGLELDVSERTLIEFAKVPQQKAVADILEKVATTKGGGSDGYALTSVLGSYEDLPVPAVIERLRSSETTEPGSILLLDFLQQAVDRMTAQQRKSVAAFVSNHEWKSPAVQRVAERLLKAVE